MAKNKTQGTFANRVLLRGAHWVSRLELAVRKQVNRALLSQMASCGQGTFLYGRVRITGMDRIQLGQNVHIGDNAFIRGEGGLSIGDNTHISRNLILYTFNHRYEGERIPYDDELVKKPVTIGRNVWIGMNVCITAGTKIGDGAIVGMGTVVSGAIPSLSIVGGAAWRELGRRDAERYKVCSEAGAYGGPSGRRL